MANTDSNTVMVGLRVQLGSQDLARVPGSLEVFGRSTHVILARSGVTRQMDDKKASEIYKSGNKSGWETDTRFREYKQNYEYKSCICDGNLACCDNLSLLP